MNEISNIHTFILAGGKSSRMGTEKGLVELGGKLFIEHILQAVIPLKTPISIIANSRHYDYLHYPVYHDLIKEKGPLGGIYTALTHSNSAYNLILSCDIPFVNTSLLHYLKGFIPFNEDALVPTQRETSEPLCAIYRKTTSEKLAECINTGILGMRRTLGILNTRYVNISPQEFYTPHLLQNINTPAELKLVQEEKTLSTSSHA